MAGNTGPDITNDGLQILIDFANKECYSGAGTTFNNLIRTNNNIGYLKNNCTYSTSNGGGIISTGGANNGQANNVGDRIDINTSAAGVDRFSGTHNFSIFFWVKQNGTGKILSTGSSGAGTGNDDNCIWQMWCSTDTFYWWNSGGGSTNNISATGTWHTLNSWQYIGFTYSYNESGNNVARCYTNGVLRFSGSTATATHSYIDRSGQTNLQWTLGGGYAGSCFTENTAASFGLFHLYNKTLSAGEVLKNYNATKSRFGL